MAFDQDKDKVRKIIAVDGEKEGHRIELKAVSYDGGEEKIQITRYVEADGGERQFRKLGRLTHSEAARVRDGIDQLLNG